MASVTETELAWPLASRMNDVDALEVTRANEWLEADGLGGFASGTTLGINTRRYHALLLAALHPPADRHVFVNDAEVWLETQNGTIGLSQHDYAPGVTWPGRSYIVAFRSEPWPRFRYRIEGSDVASLGDFAAPLAIDMQRELIVRHGAPLVLCRFQFERPLPGVRLCVRPLMSGRGYHAVHRENAIFDFTPVTGSGGFCEFRTYPTLPAVLSLANANYRHAPDWYRNFLYQMERARGLEYTEDLASPGVLTFDLADPIADWILALDTVDNRALLQSAPAHVVAQQLRQAELERRSCFSSPIVRAADAYLVRRGEGKTIIAGYPWFDDWGRDTFIALRGLCMALGRFNEAKEILLSWAPLESQGMLPNRFSDSAGVIPEYNAVDASLWYILAVGELLATPEVELDAAQRAQLIQVSVNIARGYLGGTRHGILVDTDGLVRCGVPGLQLTWMDAKFEDWVVTPRIGKPVEIQALWLNALFILGRFIDEFDESLRRGSESFRARFDHGTGGLYDVVDVDHASGKVDDRVRPNQILAVGGLPFVAVNAATCCRVLDVVERELWTPMGLRTLSRRDPAYSPKYHGGPRERDATYHQGAAWPWLAGPFIEAWVRAHGSSTEAKQQARQRFVKPLWDQLSRDGIGHLSELADGDAPHRSRGCPFQAWSLGELIRIERQVLGGPPTPTS